MCWGGSYECVGVVLSYECVGVVVCWGGSYECVGVVAMSVLGW